MIQNPVIQLNYEKRKNTKLFEQFRNTTIHDFHEIQNYIPIYNKFFDLNENNYNSFNLNHPFYLREMSNEHNKEDKEDKEDCKIVYKLKNKENDEVDERNVYVKYAPVLDPFKYFIGKYKFSMDECKLPTFVQEKDTFIHPELASKIFDVNNSAYVDGFFSYR